uniref:Uncharacterized protein n=1 Tax=Opuntia streptacantha TaxID=393608 RepID=A0A7C9CZC2_OPUST
MTVSMIVNHPLFQFLPGLARQHIKGRGVSYWIQNRTGPRTGEDRPGPARTGLFQSGPRSKEFSFSVFGPMDRIKMVARSCHSAGVVLQKKEGGPNKMGGTAVPLSTV